MPDSYSFIFCFIIRPLQNCSSKTLKPQTQKTDSVAETIANNVRSKIIRDQLIDPAFFESSKNLAIIYAMRGNDDTARSILKESIAVRPEQWEAYYYIAGTYARQNKIDESVSWLEKAVKGGFGDWTLLRTDPNLEMIRATAYYQELMQNR